MNQFQTLPHNPAESYTLGWNAEAYGCFDRFNEIEDGYRVVGVELCKETASFAAQRLAKHMRDYNFACALSRPIEADDICLWSDGTSCFVDELKEFLSFMSDDFEVIRMGTSRYDEVLEEMGY